MANNYPWMPNNQPYQSSVYSNSAYGQQSYQPPMVQQQMQQVNPMMVWVDGEAAARSFQIPAGHPLGQPYPLWDSNDMVIYLKTLDPLGRPMPLKKMRYSFEELQTSNKLEHNQSTDQFVTKEEFKALQEEIRKLTGGNQ